MQARPKPVFQAFAKEEKTRSLKRDLNVLQKLPDTSSINSRNRMGKFV